MAGKRTTPSEAAEEQVAPPPIEKAGPGESIEGAPGVPLPEFSSEEREAPAVDAVEDAAARAVPDEPAGETEAATPAAGDSYRARARVRIPFRVGPGFGFIEAGRVFTSDTIPFDPATMELLS